MADAELCEQCVDGSDLHTSTAADVTKLGCIDVILPVRHQQGQSSESFNDLLASFGTGEPLQQLLQNEPGSQYRVAVFKGSQQSGYLRDRRRSITSQRE